MRVAQIIRYSQGVLEQSQRFNVLAVPQQDDAQGALLYGCLETVAGCLGIEDHLAHEGQRGVGFPEAHLVMSEDTL